MPVHGYPRSPRRRCNSPADGSNGCCRAARSCARSSRPRGSPQTAACTDRSANPDSDTAGRWANRDSGADFFSSPTIRSIVSAICLHRFVARFLGQLHAHSGLRNLARGSPSLYTRWPKPMMRTFRASASRIHASALSGEPTSSSTSSTRSLAPPCSGPFQRADGGRHGRVQIGQRRGHHAGRKRRGVEFMLGIQNQRNFQRPHRCRAGIAPPQHSQQILGQRIASIRRDRLFALHQPMPRRHDHRQLAPTAARLCADWHRGCCRLDRGPNAPAGSPRCA